MFKVNIFTEIYLSTPKKPQNVSLNMFNFQKMAKQASEFSKSDQNSTIFKIWLLFGHFLCYTTCLMDKYLFRNQKIILKKYNKHVILPKNSQRSPSKLSRTGQI